MISFCLMDFNALTSAESKTIWTTGYNSLLKTSTWKPKRYLRVHIAKEAPYFPLFSKSHHYPHSWNKRLEVTFHLLFLSYPIFCSWVCPQLYLQKQSTTFRFPLYLPSSVLPEVRCRSQACEWKYHKSITRKIKVSTWRLKNGDCSICFKKHSFSS